MADVPYEADPTTTPVEVVQPGITTDGTGAPEQAAETEQQIAERQRADGRARAERSRRNQENAFKRLETDRQRAEARADELQRVLIEQVRGRQPGQRTDEAPKREQFDTLEQYEDARADFRYDQRAKKDQERQGKEIADFVSTFQANQQQEQLHGQHMQRVAEFAQSTPDWDSITDREDIVIPGPASEAIKHMPNGPAILLAIGTDPKIANVMHGMSATRQAAFVGQLSVSLLQRSPQVSKAPAPGTPVGGRGGSMESNPASMSSDQYYASITKHHRKGK